MKAIATQKQAARDPLSRTDRKKLSGAPRDRPCSIIARWRMLAVLGGAAVTAFVAGCAPQGLELKVTQPPECNAAGRLTKVAVLPFDGPGGLTLTPMFESMLVNTTLNGKTYFTVVDRNRLQAAVSELKLQRTGLVDERTQGRLGRMVGAQGIYSGTAVIAGPEYNSYYEERQRCVASANPKKLVSRCTQMERYTVPCQKKTVTVNVTPRLVEVETAQVVCQKPVTESLTIQYCADSGSELSDPEMLGQVMSVVMNKLQCGLAPCVVNVRAKIKEGTEGVADLSVTPFQNAVAFIKKGEVVKGRSILESIEMTSPRSLAIPFNIAVCDEAMGNLEQARVRYQALYDQLQAPDDELSQALKRINDQIANKNRLDALTQPASYENYGNTSARPSRKSIPK